MRTNPRRLCFLAAALLISFPNLSQAQVSVVREGAENPVATIAKSTLYGGAAGLVLGLAVALVAEKNEGDIIKWSFVGGTFGGFLFGIYHVATRPRPSAAILRLEPDRQARWSVPHPQIQRALDGSFAVSTNLVSISF